MCEWGVVRSWNKAVEVRERVQSNNTGTLDIAGRERVKEESRIYDATNLESSFSLTTLLEVFRHFVYKCP